MHARALSLALLLAACSSDPEGSAPDAGPPGPGPGRTADLDAEARAEALRGLAADRRLEGASFETIADELRAEDDVVEALASSSGLVFVIDGAAPTWIHAPPERGEIDAEAFTATATRGDSLVIRPRDRIDDAEKKTALIIDPFYWQFGIDLAPRAPAIAAHRDWQDARIVRNTDLFEESVGDGDFRNWNDHSFLWISTHGDRLPTSNPKYTVLFNSVMCGASGWAKQTALLTLDNRPDRQRVDLLGLTEDQMRRQLSVGEGSALDEYLKEERQRYASENKTCQVMEVSVGGVKQFLYWTAYDKGWFEAQPRLQNTVVLLSACSSSSLPLKIDETKATIFGWSQPVAVADDARTGAAFFQLMFEEGYTPQGLEDELLTRGLARSMFSTEEALFSYSGSGETRVRESVDVIDPDTLRPIQGRAVFPTREVTTAGDSLVDMDFVLIGLEDLRPQDFELRVELADGRPLRTLTPVPARDVDGLARTTLEVQLPFDVRTSPGPHDIVAKLMLPEAETGRSGRAFGAHAFEAFFEPPVDRQWSVRGSGVNASGNSILASTVRAVPDDYGTLIWSLQLGQSDGTAVPGGALALRGHPGRNADCTGDTGRFEAGLALQVGTAVEDVIATDPDDPQCSGITVDITAFDRENGLVATAQGTACRPRLNMMGEVEVEVLQITADLSWPAAGCGAEMPEPGEGFIGSYQIVEEPNVCQDIYQNSSVAVAYDTLCMMGGSDITCSDDPCTRRNSIGTCDARSAGAQSFLRGAIWVYYAGIDAKVADLELGCTTQGGIWSR